MCIMKILAFFFFFSSRRRHTRLTCDWSSDVSLPICAGEARVPPAPMPIGVERRHQVAGGAAGGVREDPLPRLLERGEPAEQHLSGIEHSGGFRRADHAPLD